MTKLSTSEPGDFLSIGELARRSGSVPSNVRSWELRHGFPRPVRLAGGHRRYREADVARVAEVLRLRRTGLSVAAAISAVTKGASRPAESFFAQLQARHPELRTQVLTKRGLRALTLAVEDEYCSRAERPVLFGAFQRAVFYRRSETRWRELARTAEHAVVFADFERVRHPRGRPVEVPLAVDAPSRREWTLVCDAPGYSACVSGWELPQSDGLADADRQFETVWTLDPAGVREAARVGIGLLAAADPHLAATVDARLSDIRPPASADLQQATTLFNRVLLYGQNLGADAADRRR